MCGGPTVVQESSSEACEGPAQQHGAHNEGLQEQRLPGTTARARAGWTCPRRRGTGTALVPTEPVPAWRVRNAAWAMHRPARVRRRPLPLGGDGPPAWDVRGHTRVRPAAVHAGPYVHADDPGPVQRRQRLHHNTRHVHQGGRGAQAVRGKHVHVHGQVSGRQRLRRQLQQRSVQLRRRRLRRQERVCRAAAADRRGRARERVVDAGRRCVEPVRLLLQRCREKQSLVQPRRQPAALGRDGARQPVHVRGEQV